MSCFLHLQFRMETLLRHLGPVHTPSDTFGPSNALQTGEIWKRRLRVIKCTEDVENGDFQKHWNHNNHVISLT